MIVEREMPPASQGNEEAGNHETRIVPFRPRPQRPSNPPEPAPGGDDPLPPVA